MGGGRRKLYHPPDWAANKNFMQQREITRPVKL